ncbi:Rv1733c family protein [Streptomyces parvus]|uniref:Rv1733c family protein n=1 Tax=Streptomyces parvus TaxID=66428 RepID=UPI0035E11BA4
MRESWALLWALLRGQDNPLRRATDRREALVALGALLLLALGAPAAGWAGGSAADAALQRSVRAQHQERHPVDAVVVGRAPGRERYVGDPEGGSERAAHIWVVASWQAPDGSPRTGEVATASGPGTLGSPLRIWTDAAGLPVAPPMDGRAARSHAVLAGIGTFLLAAGCVEAGRRVVVGRMVRQRYARLDREWAAAGADWGRAGTGG